jgi:hypothetical protein
MDQDTIRSLTRRTQRRAFLRLLGVGGIAGLAGCGSQSGTTESTGTPAPTATAEPTPEPTATAEPTDEPAETPEAVGDLAYLSPREADDFDALVEERKLAALRQVLAVDDVAARIESAVSSTAYHRILRGYDFVEILAPQEMTVEGSLDPTAEEPGSHTIEFADITSVRALVDRDTDQLVQLHTATREPHVIERSYQGLNMNTVQAAMENEQVQAALEGKDWYLLAADYSIITAYDEEHPIGVVTPVIFNWNDRGDQLRGISAAVTTTSLNDVASENEVLDVYTPTQESPDPLTGLLSEVSGTDPGPYRTGAIDVPGEMDDTDWQLRRPPNTIEQDGWEITWENTLHDAYRVTASYNGKPVLGDESKVPWMLSDYEPFGMSGPGVPSGRRNWHFWDTLGFTGPGVIEKHDLADGFRIRGSYHTGSLDHWEWRFGQNWGPYRYIIDWNFHSDGTIDVTSRHPTTGFRTTNGYPKYTFHFTAEPAFDAATVHAHDGSSWSKMASEGKMQAGDVEQVRIQNANGPERLVVERPGDVCYALQYDAETIEYGQTLDGVVKEMIQHKQYLDGDNYLQGKSIDGERVLLRMYASRDTGAGTHATTDPFAFRFTMRAENY